MSTFNIDNNSPRAKERDLTVLYMYTLYNTSNHTSTNKSQYVRNYRRHSKYMSLIKSIFLTPFPLITPQKVKSSEMTRNLTLGPCLLKQVYILHKKYYLDGQQHPNVNEMMITRHNIKGKYFGQKFQFFPPPQTKTCQFLPCFILPTPVNIYLARFKWREAPKFFSISNKNCTKKAADGAKRRKFFTILHEIVQKKLKLTITRENREEIHQNQGKYP